MFLFTIGFLAGVVITALYLFAYSLCVVASDADDEFTGDQT